MSHKPLRIAVWVLNALVAVLSILAIVSFFFLPFFRVDVKYSLSGEALKEMIGDSVDFDTSEIIGDRSVDISLGIEFGASDVFHSLSANEQEAMQNVVASNVDKIVAQLTGTLNEIARQTVSVVAKAIVHDNVKDSVRQLLSSNNPGITNEEVTEKLNAAGIDEEYIAQSTDAIVDKIFESGSTKEEVTDEIIKVTEEMYDKMSASGDPDLAHVAFTEEDKQELRQTIEDTIGELSGEDGSLDPDELIAALLLKAMNGMGGEETAHTGSGAVLLAAESSETETASEKLSRAVRDKIMELLPEELSVVITWVMRIMVILFLLSSLAWGYVLVKLIVKLIRIGNPESNPAVKLKVPIWLGWLPFLILIALPNIAFMILRSSASFMEQLSSLPVVIRDLFTTSSGVAFYSAGWIAAVAALVCFGISIFYMVVRKKFKED